MGDPVPGARIPAPQCLRALAPSASSREFPEFPLSPDSPTNPAFSRFRNPRRGAARLRGDFGPRGAGFGELRQLTKRTRFRRLIAWAYRFPRRGSRPSGFCKFWEMFLDILEAPRYANSAEYPEFSRFRNERLEWDRVHGGFGHRGADLGRCDYQLGGPGFGA